MLDVRKCITEYWTSSNADIQDSCVFVSVSGKLRKKIVELETQLKASTEQIGVHKTRSELFKRQLSEAQTDQQRLLHANKEIDQLQQLVHTSQIEQERIVREARTQLDQSSHKANELQKKLSTRNEEAEEYSAKIARLEETLKETQAQAKELQLQLEAKCDLMKVRDLTIAELQCAQSSDAADPGILDSLRKELKTVNEDKEALMEYIEMLQNSKERVVDDDEPAPGSSKEAKEAPSRLTALQQLATSKGDEQSHVDNLDMQGYEDDEFEEEDEEDVEEEDDTTFRIDEIQGELKELLKWAGKQWMQMKMDLNITPLKTPAKVAMPKGASPVALIRRLYEETLAGYDEVKHRNKEAHAALEKVGDMMQTLSVKQAAIEENEGKCVNFEFNNYVTTSFTC